MQRTAIELLPYDQSHKQALAQTFLEVFTTPPFNEIVSLNDVLAQIDSDEERPGFGGVVLNSSVAFANTIVGFSWWFDITADELYDRWRPRFKPAENIPQPEGRGCYLMEFGLLSSLRNRGLGHRLLQSSLEDIEPHHDWIAIQTHKFAHSALALLKSHAFEELELTGIQVPTRICLIKHVRH